MFYELHLFFGADKAAALINGLSGCAFMAGSVFAVTAAAPAAWMYIVLALFGFLLWIGA